MKVVVMAGKYSSIIPLFAKQFNKYFSSDVEVIVLSHKEITDLPNNFSHQKIPFTKYWCNDVKQFFDTFEEELFLGCMEDHFLHSKVDLGFLAEILECFNDESVIKYCSVKPGDWTSPIRDRPSTKSVEHNGETYEVYKGDLFFNAPVRQSLLPSIWRTSFFKLMLENSKDFNAWEFEARRNEYRLEQNILDEINDKKILFSTKQLFPMSDVVRGGEPAQNYWTKEVSLPEDIKVFEEATQRILLND